MTERRTEAPPKVGDRQPARAAERIRQSACDLFYREGIRAVGVEAIVARAGFTKPSLYRAFSSKDELATAYLRDSDAAFWECFDAGAALYPDDPRAQLRFYLEGLAARATVDGYRGCGLTNAAVEYPEPGHPARRVAEEAKQALRRRLTEIASAMGASQPEALGDGLLLLIEGAFASGQIFGTGGPARALVAAADALIDTYLRQS